MKASDYPYTISLSAASLQLYPEAPCALTAWVFYDVGSPPPTQNISIQVEGDDEGRPEVSLRGDVWKHHLSTPVGSDGTVTFFVRGGTLYEKFQLEVSMPGSANPAPCKLDVKERINPDPTPYVTALKYISGNNQFAWDLSQYDLFHEPLIVQALDAKGQVVKDAQVEFSTTSSSVLPCSAPQLTDQDGKTTSAYLRAISMSTQGATVTATCNKIPCQFEQLFVVSKDLQADLDSPGVIRVGGRKVYTFTAATADGKAWDGLSLQLSMEKGENSAFYFPDSDSDYLITVQCDAEGKAKLTIGCHDGITNGYKENMTIQAQGRPILPSIELEAIK
ncbi:Ig-like domain-containing protein [Enterobacteriaceae bacterium BIT-l23]|uniref:Ig-like domain-containing protein n=1 Tax=Jejubacter sp. L23 TaxID=3092086 RepID=UPI0015847659|nr:Ig-like domain-containing protein [Enterobacteriaceae bacterium BIT-l23]